MGSLNHLLSKLAQNTNQSSNLLIRGSSDPPTTHTSILCRGSIHKLLDKATFNTPQGLDQQLLTSNWLKTTVPMRGPSYDYLCMTLLSVLISLKDFQSFCPVGKLLLVMLGYLPL